MSLQALLDVHDAADGATPARRALLLAGLEGGEGRADPLDVEPVGRTNARLLRLRREIAGSVMEATVSCPDCGGTLEFALDSGELLALEERIVDEPTPVRVQGRSITWRPVTYDDLAAVVEDHDPGASLLARCVGEDALSETARAALVAAMADADPLLELACDLRCPHCGAAVRGTIDVPGFVWAEVEARARVLLAEIDVLARAYGWSEREILDLSSSRRARYVDLVTGVG